VGDLGENAQIVSLRCVVAFTSWLWIWPRAQRCSILMTPLQEDCRGFSCQLADNRLYQWFCRIDALEQVRAILDGLPRTAKPRKAHGYG
jgi:hypothetical protein